MKRTVEMIRLLRSIGPVRRRGGRPAHQQQPDAIRLAYFDAIAVVCRGARDAFAPELRHVVAELRERRAAEGRRDAKGPPERHVERAAAKFAASFRPTELHDVARRFGRRTSAFQRAQLDRQVRQAIGVSLDQLERPTVDRVEEWAAVNVDLIKTVPERYFDRLRLDVEDAYASGTTPEELARQLEDRFDVSLDDARRIARDQIGKLNAQVNQDRQQALGVQRFTWRTMRDNRVRDEHEALEGEVFEWGAPPAEGYPGEPIQCRCYAEPVLDDIVDGLAA